VIKIGVDYRYINRDVLFLKIFYNQTIMV